MDLVFNGRRFTWIFLLADGQRHRSRRLTPGPKRSRSEDLQSAGEGSAAEGLRGQTQTAHGPGAGDGGEPRPLWTAAEGADCSGCRNAYAEVVAGGGFL